MPPIQESEEFLHLINHIIRGMSMKKLMILAILLHLSLSAQALELVEGWNLIGHGGEDEIAVEEYFASENFSSDSQPFDRVWGWNPDTATWQIYSLVEADPLVDSGQYETLTAVEPQKGYWIKATEAVSFEYVDSETDEFALYSDAVQAGELLDDYKCETKVDGVENSIPLSWENVPSEATSLAVIMHHFPNAEDTTQANSYLLLWDIPTSVTEIPYGEADDGSWFMGSNKDGNQVSYTSPCSPSAGSHEYTITLYALSETPSSLPTESTIDVTYEVLLSAIETVTVIDTAELTFEDVNDVESLVK